MPYPIYGRFDAFVGRKFDNCTDNLTNSEKLFLSKIKIVSICAQVSLEEFLESCRATSLLAELEDDDDLPDNDGDDNDDDANEDDDDDDENYDEEGFEQTSVMRFRNTTSLSLGSTGKKILRKLV